MLITDNLIDQLLEGCNSPEDILGEAGLVKQLPKKVAKRALEAEMEMHLGDAKHGRSGHKSGNSRNGKTRKTVRSTDGEIELDVPWDRNGIFETRSAPSCAPAVDVLRSRGPGWAVSIC